MKNIFKLMGIALIAGGMMFACNKTDEDTNTPEQPQEPQGPTSSVTVTWDGSVQTFGWTDAYQSSQDPKLFWFEAAKSMNGETPECPYFVVPFWNGGAGFLPACLYQFLIPNDNGGNDTVAGNDVLPLEVFNEGGLTVEGQTIGDYQFLTYLGGQQLPTVNFDATQLTLTTSFAVRMFDYAAAAAGQDVTKDLELAFENYKFDAASAR